MFSNHITPRICNIPSIVIDPGLATVKTVGGVAVSALSVLTFGKYKAINEKAKMVDSSAFIIPNALKGLMSVVNPNYKHDPFFYGSISERISDIATQKNFALIRNRSFVKRHIVSRLSFALFGVALIVARVVEFPLGLLAVSGAILTCGKYKKTNTFAMKNLAVLGFIAEICFAVRCTVNPHQKR